MTVSHTRFYRRAHWRENHKITGIAPKWLHWLRDPQSMTAKLSACCEKFYVKKLFQGNASCLPDEYSAVGLPQIQKVRMRESLLFCDNFPVIFGHTIVPLSATAQDWPQFSYLGERPLGLRLFGDRRVTRSDLQSARLCYEHPLAKRAFRALKNYSNVNFDFTHFQIFARRRLYKRYQGLMLVTEIFLPAIFHINEIAKKSAHNESQV